MKYKNNQQMQFSSYDAVYSQYLPNIFGRQFHYFQDDALMQEYKITNVVNSVTVTP